jgi:hypothetical protein
MSLGLFTRKAKLAIAAATTVALLAGCSAAAIYQLSQPIGECNGSEVSIALGEDQDTPEVNFEDGGDIVDITFTGNLDDVEIEYRIGFYGDNGLENVNPVVMGPSPSPSESSSPDPSGSPSPTPDPVPTGTSEAFLDLFRYATEEGPHFDVTNVFATSADVSRDVGRSSDVFRFTGSVLEFFAASDGTMFDLFDDVGEEAYLTLLGLPGALLVKCIGTGEYVAATPVFPNLIVLDEVEVNFADMGSDFRFPEELNGYSFQMAGIVRTQQIPLSEEPKTDRWLQLLSTDSESEEAGFSIVGDIGDDGTISNVYESWGQEGDYTGPQSGVTYSVLVLASRLSDDVFRAKSAMFDMNFSSTGQSQYTPFEGEYLSFVAQASAGVTGFLGLDIVDKRSVAVVSSKGLRTLEVEVRNPELITSAKVGEKLVKTVKVSPSGNLVIELPKLPAGVYDLTLYSGTSPITKANFIKIRASNQLDSLVIPGATSKQSWNKQLRSALGKHSDTSHVVCTAMVPEGASVASLDSKAREICSSVRDSEITTRVVVKELPASGVPRVVVNLWK